MPFVLISQYPLERPGAVQQLSAAFIALSEQVMRQMPWLGHFARPTIMIIALIVELLILWAVIAFLGFSPPPHAAPESSPTVFALTPENPKEQSGSAAPKVNISREDNDVTSPKLQPIAETAPPVEWSVERITISGGVSENRVSNADKSAQGGAADKGQSGGAYDPYAGAAMLPLDRNLSADAVAGVRIDWPAGEGANAWNAANRRALIEWLRTLKRRLPQSQGSILLKLKTNEDGAVMAADIMGGDALPQIKQFIANHAKANLRLSIGTPSEMLMPELEMVI